MLYIDTSVAVAMLAGEKNAAQIAKILNKHKRLISCDLFNAELFSVSKREKLSDDDVSELASQVEIICSLS